MPAASALSVGTAIPPFTLPDQHGKPFASKQLIGEPAVIYFYPKADTSSCTKEACAFNEALPALGGLGVRVVGISPDPSKALKNFADKYGLGFTLLGDVPEGEGKKAVPRIIDSFGVWGEKSMYGNTYMGVIRTTLLVDAKGRIVRAWENVKVPGHAADVMEAVKGLTGGGTKRVGVVEVKPTKSQAKKKPAGRIAVKKTASRKGKK